jgi:acyl carrier protein
VSSTSVSRRVAAPTLEEVRALVRGQAPSFWKSREMPPDLRLDDSGIGFDSVGLFELLIACERELGINLPPDLLLERALTIGGLHQMLARLALPASD